MNRIFTILAAFLLTVSAFAQSPEKISYQAVIRNSSNVLVTNTQIGMEINIRQGSPSGTVVYTETQTPTTNANGLASIEIGGGAGFNVINWANGPYFIETNTALVPPLTTYTITGVSQLLSVPYALFSKTAESISGGITETDPVFGASIAAGISDVDTANWNNKLDSYTETDPVFDTSIAAGITATDTAYWNDKFNLPALSSGSILFSNGTTLAEDNNNLYWDNTNKRLGIGTNSPGVQLEIKNTNSNLSNAILKVINNNGDSILTVSGNRTDICLDSTTGSFNIYQVVSTQKKQLFRINPSNCFIGYKSGINNGTGINNFFAGNEAGASNTTGDNNTFIGYQSGFLNQAGNDNVYLGYQSGYISGTNGGNNNYRNVFIGPYTGYNSKGIAESVFIGYNAGRYNTTGSNNTFIGGNAGFSNISGNSNIFVGSSAGDAFTAGGMNICIGDQTAHSNVSGINNTMIGYQAGYDNTGSGNVFLGYNAGYYETGSNKLYIDNSSITSPLIYGDFNINALRVNGNMGVNYGGVTGYGLIVETPASQTEIYALYVMGNAYATGNWNSSDEAFKKNIVPLQNSLDRVLAINGYTYDWKKEEFPERNFDDRKQIGLIAQDIEKLFPELVKADEKGFKAIDYSRLTVVLIEAIKEQQKQILSQKEENNALLLKVEKTEESNKELSRRLDQLEKLLVHD